MDVVHLALYVVVNELDNVRLDRGKILANFRFHMQGIIFRYSQRDLELGKKRENVDERPIKTHEREERAVLEIMNMLVFYENAVEHSEAGICPIQLAASNMLYQLSEITASSKMGGE